LGDSCADPSCRSIDLKVSVRDGTAVLSGSVEEDVSKDLANQFALGVSGIKDVDNNIEIEPEHVPSGSSDARTFGEYIDDVSINAAVKSKRLWSKHADGHIANVDTKNGKVSLVCAADSAAARELAGRLAISTHGTKRVTSNNLKI
jgi:hyperosmotically inducible protein